MPLNGMGMFSAGIGILLNGMTILLYGMGMLLNGMVVLLESAKLHALRPLMS